MHAPRTGHLDAVHCVLKCLKGFRAMEHFYSYHGHLDIAAYSDVNWAEPKFDKMVHHML